MACSSEDFTFTFTGGSVVSVQYVTYFWQHIHKSSNWNQAQPDKIWDKL